MVCEWKIYANDFIQIHIHALAAHIIIMMMMMIFARNMCDGHKESLANIVTTFC